MRRFVCASCGQGIEIGWCTNQRGRDLQCPDCGGRVYRDHAVGGITGGRRGRFERPAAVAGGQDTGTGRDQANVFGFQRWGAAPATGSGRCRGGRRAGGRRSS